MPSIPRATTRISDTAGAVATGLDTVCIITPCAQSADYKPRLFGTASAVYAQHGYCEGVEYAAHHIQRTRRGVLVVGVPIDVPGAIGREDTSGNDGTSVTTVTAGADGVLAEHDGYVAVIQGGTIGTDQIILGVSMNGGRTVKRVRLGTASSYTIPYFGVSIGFGAGYLTTGDVVHIWHGTAPSVSAESLTTARTKLAESMKFFRSIVLCGDLGDVDQAAAFRDELNAYETENERFIYGRASLRDRLPYASLSATSHRVTGTPTFTFETTNDTITRSAGNWANDGFAVGDKITIAGSASNNTTHIIESIDSATVISVVGNLVDEGPVANVAITGQPTLVFANTGETITRSRGSFLADGFRVGDSVTIDGTSGGTNDGTFTVGTLTELVMTLASGSVDADETIGVTQVTFTAGETKPVWMANLDAEFESISDDKRIDLAAGRLAILSPFSGWVMRRSVGWFASWREYQHDLHVATWRKEDGPIGGDLEDEEGTLVEWDDRVDGGAGSAARFTTARSYSNGPAGAFITMSLTRAAEGSVLSLTHNMAVTNLACTTCQLNTENAIGRSLVLNDNGTATEGSLREIEAQVNAALDLALLQNARGEGRRASKAVWTASREDVLNVPEATLNGVLELNLNGTIHSVNTTVRVASGGQ